MKPIIFTGDSFTFGEGLELYDENFHKFVKNLTNLPDRIRKGKYAPSFGIQDEYFYNWSRFEATCWGGTASNIRNLYKFPTLVASEFNCTFFSKGHNGGDNIESLEFVESLLGLHPKDTFSCVIMNLTCMERDEYQSSKEYFLDKYKINFGFGSDRLLSDFMYHWFRWSYEKSNMLFSENIDEYHKFFEDVIPVDSAIKLQEEYKTYYNFEYDVHLRSYRTMIDKIKKIDLPLYFIGHWNGFDNTILNNINDEDVHKYIIDKTIPIKIENKYYKSLSELPHRPDLFINTEFEWTHNAHPSKTLHGYIAESISEFLKQKINKTI